MDPMEMMTPQSYADEKLEPHMLVVPEQDMDEDMDEDLDEDLDDLNDDAAPTESSSSEKKPAKKRKSWGQVLPEPKTNLPPRYVEEETLTVSTSRASCMLTAFGLLESEPRLKMKRNSVALSVFSATVAPLSHRERERDSKSRPSRSATKSWRRS